jgi:cytochrome P450
VISRSHAGLRSIPGPVLSAYTGIPLKVQVLAGRRSLYIHSLHGRYGTIPTHSSLQHSNINQGPYVRIAPHEVAIADIQAYHTIHRIGSDFNKGPWYAKQVPCQYSDETSGVFNILSNKAASRRRRLFQAAGTRNIVAEWEPQVIELANLAVQRIQADLEHGQCDIMKWWTFLASDVTGSLAFGEPFGNLKTGHKSGLVEDIEAAMPIIGIRAELPWLKHVLDHTPTWCGNTWSARLHRFVGYGWDAVRATRAAHAGGNRTLFSRMVLDDEKKQVIPDSAIVSEAANVIVAGTDTTAMTLTYLTYSVLKHEHIKQQLVAEVKTLPKNPQWDELEGLTYLKNVIQEALRLHPAVPGSLVRIVPATGAQFDKYVIPAGTQVCTQAWTFQRDADVFEDPLRYVRCLCLTWCKPY